MSYSQGISSIFYLVNTRTCGTVPKIICTLVCRKSASISNVHVVFNGVEQSHWTVGNNRINILYRINIRRQVDECADTWYIRIQPTETVVL